MSTRGQYRGGGGGYGRGGNYEGRGGRGRGGYGRGGGEEGYGRGGGGRGRYEEGGRGFGRGRGGSYEGRGGSYEGRGGYEGGRGSFDRGGRGGRGGGGGFVDIRPGPIEVLANHFRTKTSGISLVKHHVTITDPEDEHAEFTLPIRRELFNRAKGASCEPSAMMIHDGDHIALAKTPISFETELLHKRRKVMVRCQPQGEVKLGGVEHGELSSAGQEGLQALDIILKAAATQRAERYGPLFLHDTPNAIEPLAPPDVALWWGHRQSSQVTSVLATSQSPPPPLETSLVINAAGAAAYRDITLSEWTQHTLQHNILELKELTPDYVAAFKTKIAKLKFEVRHLPPKRSVVIDSVAPETARTYSFEFNGEMTPIQEYFRMQYNIELRYPDAPLLKLAPKRRNLFMPAELIFVSRQKIPKPQKDVQRRLLERLILSPERRANLIQTALTYAFDRNPILDYFDIKIDPQMMAVHGEVLEPPVLAYRRPGQPQTQETMPVQGGKWNLMRKAFVSPQCVANWAVLNLLGPNKLPDIREFMSNFLIPAAEKLNMKMNPMPRFTEHVRSDEEIEQVAARWKEMKAANKVLDTIFVFIERPDTAVYAKIKGALDEVACSQVLTAEKTPILNNTRKGVDGHLGNILSKVNMKNGGVCQHIAHNDSAVPALRLFLRDPKASCIVACGHALRQVQVARSRLTDKIPTVTAMVCSLDPQCGAYLHTLRVQQAGTESLDNLVEMLSYLMRKRCLQLQSDVWPNRLIYLREGLSDGSLAPIAKDEIQNINAAYKSANQPPPCLLYVAVRKRQPTRFFPKNSPANVPPGTCIFDELSLAMPFPSFYLVSQKGIKGTSNPARYAIIYDTLKDGVPDLKEMDSRQIIKAYAHLCFQLCHLYGRCQGSVSVPAPVYYVQLLNSRAKVHINSLVYDTFGIGLLSEATSASSHDKDNLDVRDMDRIINAFNRKLREIDASPLHFYC
eukprot:Blabericola_migrator_1__7847@NODE_400_length_8905_cov_313_446821_g317_i0_p1_GENE_NODE_400_length_8905_cov_313_446821_g317_i0NODE_400_length_8905_cov_313_446821_g317_i0_p1_ORF_typecomplete_len965_score180_64Piwi/PF02171_17/1_3e53PAZ/PF02170_22/6_1e15ArgoMid/PF16487_5/3_3e08ArgoL2/PF16488_5/3_1e07ArgoN/PF16486_5/1_6e06ArgoN/PF16486_5/1_3e04_NODE_400_length_8905_cov_313_446821_g317_i026255519